jgi:hypothetical protein
MRRSGRRTVQRRALRAPAPMDRRRPTLPYPTSTRACPCPRPHPAWRRRLASTRRTPAPRGAPSSTKRARASTATRTRISARRTSTAATRPASPRVSRAWIARQRPPPALLHERCSMWPWPCGPTVVLSPENRRSIATAPRLLWSVTMKTRALLVRGSCLLVLAGLVAASAGCEERVVVRHPAPVVRVYSPPVVEERVLIR